MGFYWKSCLFFNVMIIMLLNQLNFCNLIFNFLIKVVKEETHFHSFFFTLALHLRTDSTNQTSSSTNFGCYPLFFRFPFKAKAVCISIFFFSFFRPYFAGFLFKFCAPVCKFCLSGGEVSGAGGLKN